MQHVVSIRVKGLTFGSWLWIMLACSGASRSASVSSPLTPRLPPIRPDWCISATERVDSAFAVVQAKRILQDTSLSLKPSSVTPVGPQSLLDDRPMFQGFLVSLGPARRPLVLGGGALVWIDGETGCAIVLKRYE